MSENEKDVNEMTDEEIESESSQTENEVEDEIFSLLESPDGKTGVEDFIRGFKTHKEEGKPKDWDDDDFEDVEDDVDLSKEDREVLTELGFEEEDFKNLPPSRVQSILERHRSKQDTGGDKEAKSELDEVFSKIEDEFGEEAAKPLRDLFEKSNKELAEMKKALGAIAQERVVREVDGAFNRLAVDYPQAKDEKVAKAIRSKAAILDRVYTEEKVEKSLDELLQEAAVLVLGPAKSRASMEEASKTKKQSVPFHVDGNKAVDRQPTADDIEDEIFAAVMDKQKSKRIKDILST